MYVETWQIIVYTILVMLMMDFIRLLFLKVAAKKYRLFALVPDNEQLRLKYLSDALGVEVTKLVNKESNVYYIVDNPDEEYILFTKPGYRLEKASEIGVKKQNKK